MNTRDMSFVDKIIRFFLDNKLVTAIFLAGVILWGIAVAPFDWNINWMSRSPVPVDAIPDIGENQQIVFTKWMGRSPKDIEDQVTYPLTVALLGVPEVKTVRSFSMFGFSSIYVVFKEGVDFYWTRSRILEKLSSLPKGTLPEGVKPTMGPDATALGQVFWYTLEGRDQNGKPAPGWDLQELRSIQDWQVRYSLMSADGVSEVASIGGYEKEYQIDIDPDAMRAHGVTMEMVYMAAKMSNLDVAARTIEINSVEYVIRGIGFVKTLSDIENSVVKVVNNVPIRIKDVAKVHLGPALRRGVLDKSGAEVVGGVVVARYGENPLSTIKNVEKKIEEISKGLPEKKLDDGRVSKVTIVPFYNRSGLIMETLGTLNDAIFLEILITILVILFMLNNIQTSLIISSILPAAVLMSFISMKLFHVDANIVSLSGIAIAIGTIVDMGIVLSENVVRHISNSNENGDKKEIIFKASSEVGGAILTAVLTTVVSFLPVFTMQAAEGKLFKPLAFTKTFALLASITLALTVLPSLIHVVIGRKKKDHSKRVKNIISGLVVFLGIIFWVKIYTIVGIALVIIGLKNIIAEYIPDKYSRYFATATNFIVMFFVTLALTGEWLPLGAQKSFVKNLAFVLISVGGLLSFFKYFATIYPRFLKYFLEYKMRFLIPVIFLILWGFSAGMGFSKTFFFIPKVMYKIPLVTFMDKAFPGLEKEFMPSLDEGSYLYMPTTMTHASIGEVHSILQKQDMAINSIPEVESAVGKLGRVESSLDPAPISMIETIINIKPEYIVDKNGNRMRFKYDKKSKEFVHDENNNLIQDKNGKPFRQWRNKIKKADDIWNEIVKVSKIPGVTSAPKLQPIAARIVMLQSGMRAPMGIKVKGPDLNTIEKFGIQLEALIKEVPSVNPATVIADRIVGKPYLEIHIDRAAIARYGMSIKGVQNAIETAIGGKTATSTVEGRERYNIRVRYPRELRGLYNGVEDLKSILITASNGVNIPLGQVATIEYTRGPQVIKSEDTFLTGYVLFDKQSNRAEVDVVEEVQKFLNEKIEKGELKVPSGVSYKFAGNYENQIRSAKRLAMVLPIAMFAIFLLLYFQFKKISTTLLVFSGIIIAWAGGFLLIWFYGMDWFLNIDIFGENLRDLFQVHTVNLSVAVWVGFLALFGIASDNGVIICTYLDQLFKENPHSTVDEVRRITIEAATRRVKPALMTSATTILALLPILTSTGRGSDIMIPMAIPSFGGMMIQLITIFLVPVLYSALKEFQLKRKLTD